MSASKKQFPISNSIGGSAMTLRASRRLVHSSLLLVLAFLAGGACAAGMETVKVAPDQKGFVLHPSGDRYIPWIAENSGIHLKITGLACYKIKDRMAWYERSTR